ncbi:major histocompatibility complex class I-related gene protein-like isoform X2 [Hemicordylus capensis]|uniref:major histocompatibility complex class I-related gene protein-like isoform X2 n=1 Tax=Hemicordylus capensis TaxID=884348 RepID=UPI002302C1AA|nr:major histocompatibility complex class I-related gene protein-like isoform X2 [Hemicordylus capensis]
MPSRSSARFTCTWWRGREGERRTCCWLQQAQEDTAGTPGTRRIRWRAGGLEPPDLESESRIIKLWSQQGSSSHSLKYFFMSVSEPDQGLPKFISVGYVDDQPFVHYDSNSRRSVPQVPWMKKAEKVDPKYWHKLTQMSQGTEEVYRINLAKAMDRYNNTEGLHTVQCMSACELSNDGHKSGRLQYGYDGQDYISLDTDTLTWTAADAPAFVTKENWESDVSIAEQEKSYLEEDCIEWLQEYLDYGKETLLRTEPPTVKVARKAGYDGMETHICQAHGFYPKEIEINWMRDGEVWTEDTFRGQGPNSDGTYHSWLSIEMDPKDRGRYQCHVEHDGLEEPLDLVLEKPAFMPGAVILGAILGAAIVLAVTVVLVAGIILYNTSDQGSDISVEDKWRGL